MRRLANATKGNRCATTINHKRSTVGGGGLGGAVIVITESFTLWYYVAANEKTMLDMTMAMHAKAMGVDT